MEVQFVASIAPIVAGVMLPSPSTATRSGLSSKGGEGDYVFTHRLAGVKHLGCGHSRTPPRRSSEHVSGRRHPRSTAPVSSPERSPTSRQQPTKLERSGDPMIHGAKDGAVAPRSRHDRRVQQHDAPRRATCSSSMKRVNARARLPRPDDLVQTIAEYPNKCGRL